MEFQAMSFLKTQLIPTQLETKYVKHANKMQNFH